MVRRATSLIRPARYAADASCELRLVPEQYARPPVVTPRRSHCCFSAVSQCSLPRAITAKGTVRSTRCMFPKSAPVIGDCLSFAVPSNDWQCGRKRRTFLRGSCSEQFTKASGNRSALAVGACSQSECRDAFGRLRTAYKAPQISRQDRGERGHRMAATYRRVTACSEGRARLCPLGGESAFELPHHDDQRVCTVAPGTVDSSMHSGRVGHIRSGGDCRHGSEFWVPVARGRRFWPQRSLRETQLAG